MYLKHGKRIFDIFASVVMLLLLTPFLFVIILISLCAHGYKNIFFLQERVGFRGRIFRIVKFKTMTDAKDRHGNLLPDEDRQTEWGNIMRKYSLDELLQLINVIKGDMSIVGPRPFMAKYVENLNKEEAERFNVRPGITGLAQVCGRNDLSYCHRFRYDVWYVHHLNPVLDLQILLMTAKLVISGCGVEYKASVESEVCMRKQ